MYLKDDEKGAASGGAQQPGAGEGERRRVGCRAAERRASRARRSGGHTVKLEARAAERRGGRVRWPRPERAAFLRGATYRRMVRR